jgi:acetyl-CoA synthetase
MNEPISPEQLIACGLNPPEAASLASRIKLVSRQDPIVAWREISHNLLSPRHPFAAHKLLFESVFSQSSAERGPAPAWVPTDDEVRQSNCGRLMHEHGFSSVTDLHAWSVGDRGEFWSSMIRRLGIILAKPFDRVVDVSAGADQAAWLCGARLNIVESCFNAEPDKLAIVYHDEQRRNQQVTYRKLSELANRVANGLVNSGSRPGDAWAIYMPMTIESVAIYLGIIRAGCVAVSIADSLAAEEIAVRMRISAARGIFTQDVMVRGGKPLPLYAKVIEAGAPPAVVIVSDKNKGRAEVRAGDSDWKSFIDAPPQFSPHVADPNEPTNILFSSGTTGEPKAIPWTHVTPIKCAVDGYLHQDIQPRDRVAWPTNLGWMMGPWLIYAGLINRATIALYGGAPTGGDFGRFVEKAGVTMLGVIPSLVKTWRASRCMESADWTCIQRFSSTGECSNPDDMLYLMSLAGYKPVIEYCGGTELGGGYIGSTVAQPNAPSTFSTPSFGTALEFGDDGEVFLVPPSIGMSTRLLNHHHHDVYYADTPRGPKGEILRRHGDALERLGGGYWRAQGRVDDTMNLGGIKVSSVEIERVLNAVEGVRETAAIGCAPPGGGPSQLWIFVVLQSTDSDLPRLRAAMQEAIRRHLNPLFKIHDVVAIDLLPRTASHKIMRRLLRDRAEELNQAKPPLPA